MRLIRVLRCATLVLNFVLAYLFNDDDFNYNIGIAKCSVGHYKEGEEHLCMVQNEKVGSQSRCLR